MSASNGSCTMPVDARQRRDARSGADGECPGRTNARKHVEAMRRDLPVNDTANPHCDNTPASCAAHANSPGPPCTRSGLRESIATSDCVSNTGSSGNRSVTVVRAGANLRRAVAGAYRVHRMFGTVGSASTITPVCATRQASGCPRSRTARDTASTPPSWRNNQHASSSRSAQCLHSKRAGFARGTLDRIDSPGCYARVQRTLMHPMFTNQRAQRIHSTQRQRRRHAPGQLLHRVKRLDHAWVAHFVRAQHRGNGPRWICAIRLCTPAAGGAPMPRRSQAARSTAPRLHLGQTSNPTHHRMRPHSDPDGHRPSPFPTPPPLDSTRPARGARETHPSSERGPPPAPRQQPMNPQAPRPPGNRL